MEFNEKLQQLRKEKEMTQEQLAAELFVSRTAVSKWESGGGYPSIDSLKAISKLFSVSIDNLLSGEELVTLAETDKQESMTALRDLIFGVSDCILAVLFFLPFFAQREGEMVRTVSLLLLNNGAPYIRVIFITYAGLATAFGIAELALQNFSHRIWARGKTACSLLINVFGTMLFIASPQPYAASFLFCLLIIKAVLLYKMR